MNKIIILILIYPSGQFEDDLTKLGQDTNQDCVLSETSIAKTK